MARGAFSFLRSWLCGFGSRGGSDLAQGGKECFGFGLGADGDAKEVGHGWESAAHDNVLRFEPFDEGLNVGAHINHDEVCMGWNEGAAIVSECITEPGAAGDEAFAAGGYVLGIIEAGQSCGENRGVTVVLNQLL